MAREGERGQQQLSRDTSEIEYEAATWGLQSMVRVRRARRERAAEAKERPREARRYAEAGGSTWIRNDHRP